MIMMVKTDAPGILLSPIIIRINITWINKHGEETVTKGNVGMNLMRVAHQHNIEVNLCYPTPLQQWCKKCPILTVVVLLIYLFNNSKVGGSLRGCMCMQVCYISLVWI